MGPYSQTEEPGCNKVNLRPILDSKFSTIILESHSNIISKVRFAFLLELEGIFFPP